MSQYVYIFQITAISQVGREKRNSGDLAVGVVQYHLKVRLHVTNCNCELFHL